MRNHKHRRFADDSSRPSSKKTDRILCRAAGGLWARSGLERLEPRMLLDATLHDDHDHETLVDNYLPPAVFKYNRTGLLTGVSQGKPLDIALNYLRNNPQQFNLEAADLETPFITNQYKGDTGITYIYLMQEYNGLGVANARMTVSVMPDGRILSAGGTFVRGLGTADRNAPAPTPQLDPRQALRSAAEQLEVQQTRPIAISDRTSRLDKRQTVTAPDFAVDPFQASLQYIAAEDGSVQLGWKMILEMPGGKHWYELTIDSTRGGIIDATSYGNHAVDPKGDGIKAEGSGGVSTAQSGTGPAYNVIAAPVAHPYDPSQATAPNRSMVFDPVDTLASPFGWHDTNGVPGPEFTITQGNNVHAYLDRDNNNAPDPGSSPDGGPNLIFDFPLDLSLSPLQYQPAAVTNLFYWNNLIHDVTYRYGFTEVAGNFQTNNYGRGGVGNDSVMAEAQDSGGTNNANFFTPADGQRPRMQMYLWTSTTPQRDGDLDNRIIVHEYGHGISNRVTGGPSNASALSNTQSRGMGEGWSDFFSLLFTQKITDTANQKVGVGTYSLGQGNDGKGVRRFPYSYNMLIQPLTFDAYGSGSVVYQTETGPVTVTKSTQVHATGEIWCAALWDMTWNLIDKYGFSENFAAGWDPANGHNKGNQLAMKLVMEGLRLQPANPSVIHARDAILAADNALTGGANFREIWSAFARRGLGASAATAGSTSTTITTSYDLPAALIDPFINTATPSGAISTPITSITLSFAEAMNTGTFSIVDDVHMFTGPGGVNLIPSITGFTWTNNRTLRLDLQPQRANGDYLLVVGPDITAADDGAQMDQNGNGTPGEPDDGFTLNITKSGAVGPRITAHTPSGSISFVGLSQFEMTFSEAINQSTFSIADDVVSFTGPGNTDLLSQIIGHTWVNATTLRVTMNPQQDSGVYSMVLGPNISATLDGAVMDQNSDGTAGTPADRYTASVELDRFPGPDGFGYESNNYPAEQLDLVIGDPGVITLVNGSDDVSNPINLGSNTFNYYGTSYTGTGGATGIFASPNGLVSFGAAVTTWTNTDMQTSPTQPVLAVLWDDWRTDGANAPGATDSAVLYKIDGDRLIIEWSDVCNRTQSQGSVTFQAILELNTGSEPGRIIFNYIDLNHDNATFHNGGSASVGIKNAGTQSASNPAAHRLLISMNNSNHPWVKSNTAIVFDQDVVPPRVSSAAFNFLTSQSVTVQFDEDVTGVDVSNLILHNTTTGVTVDPGDLNVAYDPNTRVATVTFPGLPGGILEDGNYTASFLDGIKDAAGNPLDGDFDFTAGGNYNFNFFFLNGDANRDGVVNLADFNILAANFGQSPRNFSQGDFNYDGIVNLADFNILASRFGTSLSTGSTAGGEAGQTRETLPPPPTGTSTGTRAGATDGATTLGRISGGVTDTRNPFGTSPITPPTIPGDSEELMELV